MQRVHRVSPCLWFDSQAEDAARYYTSIFPNSTILSVSHYPDEGREVHGQPPGKVLTVSFELDGSPLTALNGGPVFQFNEAVSLQVFCDTQDELDHFWHHLSAGGDERAQQCGWLRDKFGVFWQTVPRPLDQWMRGDPAGAARVMRELLQMKKLDMAKLQRAFDG